MNRSLALLVGLLLPVLAYSDCVMKQDFRSDKKNGIVVNALVVSGTRAVDTSELADITSNFAGSCFNDDSEEIGERLRDQFQQHGYFMVKIGAVRMKASDPLAKPKPVTVEAEVEEGPRFTVGEVVVAGSRAIDAQRVATEYPLRPGSTFDTAKVRSGLEAVRRLYASKGYLDFFALPDANVQSNATVALKITITEGKQYRFGKLEITGERDEVDRLLTKWELPQGAPYDAGYLSKFLDSNHSVLPAGFNEQSNIDVLRNCKENTVLVRIRLDSSPASHNDEPGCQR